MDLTQMCRDFEFCTQNEVSALIITSTQVISTSLDLAPKSRAVENFVNYNHRNLPLGTNKFIDYTAKYAREKLKFLLVDVCLGNGDSADVQSVNRTIQIINRLIGEISKINPTFKVFDFRASRFFSENGLYTEIICQNYSRLSEPGLWIDEQGNFDEQVLAQLDYFQAQGFQLNKLYYKPGFDELVDEIEKDFESEWLKAIREEFLEKYYSNFDLDNLKMIVVGSSGVDYYNTLRTLVADEDFTGIPNAVKNFTKYLNEAVSNKRGVATKQNRKYDYHCFQSLDHVLFINVCHSRVHDLDDAICSIKFVNKILEKFKDIEPIAIIDLRLGIHTDKENAKPDSIVQDSRTEYLRDDRRYKIDNPDDYHRYVRLGNPGYASYVESDETYCAEQLRKLKDEFPIAKLFEPNPNFQTSQNEL